MKNRQLMLLIAAIFLAPNANQWVALAIAGLATGLSFALKD